MAYALGINVGESSTMAAICRTGAKPADAGELIGLGTHSTAAPSVVWVGEDGQWRFGDDAEAQALDRPDLVVRNFTSQIGDPLPMVVGSAEVLPEELMARMARWAVDTTTEQEGTEPDKIAVAHPASWDDDQCSLLRWALDAAGLHRAVLVAEPAAHDAARAAAGVPSGQPEVATALGAAALAAAAARSTALVALTRSGPGRRGVLHRGPLVLRVAAVSLLVAGSGLALANARTTQESPAATAQDDAVLPTAAPVVDTMSSVDGAAVDGASVAASSSRLRTDADDAPTGGVHAATTTVRTTVAAAVTTAVPVPSARPVPPTSSMPSLAMLIPGPMIPDDEESDTDGGRQGRTDTTERPDRAPRPTRTRTGRTRGPDRPRHGAPAHRGGRRRRCAPRRSRRPRHRAPRARRLRRPSPRRPRPSRPHGRPSRRPRPSPPRPRR